MAALAFAALIGYAPRTFANAVVITVLTNWSSITTGTGGGQPTAADSVTVDGGTLVVDVPNGVCASLTLGGTSGGTINFQSGSQVTVSGNVNIGAGTSPGTLNMSAGGTLICHGFAILGGPNTVDFTAGTVALNATNSLPPGLSPFNNLTVSSGTTTLGELTHITGALSIVSNATLTDPDSALSLVGGTTTIDGTLNFQAGGSPQFSGAVTVSATGKWQDNGSIAPTFVNDLNANGMFAVGSGTYTFDTSGPSSTFSGAATIPQVMVNGGFTFTNSGNLTLTNLTGSSDETFMQAAGASLSVGGTISSFSSVDPSAAGNTVIYTGGTVAVAQPVYSTASPYYNLTVSGHGSIAGAMVTGTLSVTPASAQLDSGNCTLDVNGTVSIDGILTLTQTTSTFHVVNINSTGQIAFEDNASSAPDVTLTGLVTVAGLWADGTGATGPAMTPKFKNGLTVTATGSFQGGPGTYHFDVNDQDIVGTVIIHDIAVNGGITLTNKGQLTSTFDIIGSGSETIKQFANSTLSIGGSFSTITLNAAAAGNTVVYNGSSQTVAAAQYCNLSLFSQSEGSAGTVILASGLINISGTLDASGLSNVGFSGAGNSIAMNGAAPQQIIGGGSSLLVTNDLILANSAGVTLVGGDFLIGGQLNFGAGNLITGSNAVHFNSSPAPVSASTASHIVGNQFVTFMSGSAQSFTFDVGDASTYAPVTFSNLSVATGGGSIQVSTKPGNHPSINTSGLDPTKTAKRFWTVSSPDLGASTTFDAIFNFVAGDVAAGNPANFLARRFNSPTWSPAIVGSKTTTSTKVTGVDCSALGDFQLGEVLPGVPAITSQLALTIAAGVPFNYNITATNSPTAFNAANLPAGLTVNGGTGLISGTPTAGGTFNIALSASNAGGLNVGTATLALTILSGQPVFDSGGVTITGENVVGQQLTFTGSATDSNGLALTYHWDFGDGSTASGAFVQHVYNAGGNFTINLTVSNGVTSATLPIPINIIAPATGAEGVGNIGQDDTPVTNVFNGISISVDFSDGGVIGLSIDINALVRSAFNVSTDFSGTGGSLGTRGGLNPIMQFTNSGVFVATTSATEATTNSVAGKARKTLAVGDKEVGIPLKYKNDPKSPKIKTGKIAGKFSFARSGAASTAKADVVGYTGTFELAEGLDLASKPTFAFSIGNIVDSITVDAKGKGITPSAGGFIKKVQVKFPKLPRGSTMTMAGQTATFQVNVAGVDLSSKGFDTEGIQGSVLASEKSLKTVPRSIQIAMVFGGAAYDATADVSFKLGTGGTSGAIGTRH